MTVPTTIILPVHSGDNQNLEKYLQELITSLQIMYEKLAQGTNGDLQSDFGVDTENWTPTLSATTNPGTFTYTRQSGIVLRKGLMVDLWFDIEWSSIGLAAGNLYLELPYQVAVVNDKPFVGIVQSSLVTYTGGTGIVMNAVENTYRGEFWNIGDAFTTANQLVVGSGQLIGHIRYLGQSDEF